MIIVKNVIQRRKGVLYYIDTKGNLCGSVMIGNGFEETICGYHNLMAQILEEDLKQVLKT